jgi:adenosine deaminase
MTDLAHITTEKTHRDLLRSIIRTISETNGVSLKDTLELMASGELKKENALAYDQVEDFRHLLAKFSIDQIPIQTLIAHPFAHALSDFFRLFPLKFNEEHIHLTGALTAEFIYPRLKKLIEGPNSEIYRKKIVEVYGQNAWPIQSVSDVDKLIRLKETEGFNTYLRILYLPKLILIDKQAHIDSAYHMASELYSKYNVGKIRLKFMLSRAASNSSDQIPGVDEVSTEDVVLGLFEGFNKFKNEHPDFDFVLSPSFRKERTFFDSTHFSSRKEHFENLVDQLVRLLEKFPQLTKHVTDVDTVGNEKDLYRKEHFNELQKGFRKLQYRGLKIRSHHGETFHTLKKGIQAVDNAMNIWHIDTLEHGLSLGINPNFYFHRLYQKVMEKNRKGQMINNKDPEYNELSELDWGTYSPVLAKLQGGQRLDDEEHTLFIKAKFHTAREVEHYQHDVLNRLIQKSVTLIALPSSNNKLTGQLEDYKDHPFSWWEKKGVNLGVGTDNYVTLNTNYIQEMLIILFTDASDLKITKLLMVSTGEQRRPFISHLLWKMRKLRI